MDYERMEELYSFVYSSRPGSKERAESVERLSDQEQSALYDFDIGVLSGRIKKPEHNVKEVFSEMTYLEYKEIMGRKDNSGIRRISAFAKEHPSLYQRYRGRYGLEVDEKLRDHNRKLSSL